MLKTLHNYSFPLLKALNQSSQESIFCAVSHPNLSMHLLIDAHNFALNNPVHFCRITTSV